VTTGAAVAAAAAAGAIGSAMAKVAMPGANNLANTLNRNLPQARS
jgi:NAD(P)H-hydrate repair Nnr-like enzyme with NAD(P)H-hydrate dehydratase domain